MDMHTRTFESAELHLSLWLLQNPIYSPEHDTEAKQQP